MNLDSLKSDKVYGDWIESLNSRTAATYRYGVLAYCEHTGKSCSQLINEAKEDYINKVTPWEIRHIKQFESFIQHIKKDKDISDWGKLSFINAVRHFYKHNKIPIEGVSRPNIPAKATDKYLDLPVLTLDDVRKAVLSCGVDDKLTKALILTFLSSGQAQAEIRNLRGKHLKNLVNGVAVVNMTRGKTNRRYTFFIGHEALTAIRDYRPNIGENELVFTQKNSNKPLNTTYIGTIFKRLAAKIGWDRSYFQPHRFRHYFKSQLSGNMDTIFIEYLMGHKLPGVESNYFLGNQDKMIEAYIKNQQLLTVFTDKETLQKKYDDLKKDKSEIEALRQQLNNITKYLEGSDKSSIQPGDKTEEELIREFEKHLEEVLSGREQKARQND